MNNIKIIPLGGIKETGKNIYIVEVDDSIFVLDCGLVYPEDSLLGIDAVIPDFSYLIENQDRVVGVFLTHGHADAVGALPYLLSEINVPVFGTQLTIALAELMAKQHKLHASMDQFYVIDEETEIEFQAANVSFFKTTHTIPDSVGIVIHTDLGAIVYTGDFKFDPSVPELYATDFGRLTDLGEEGVYVLMSDSVDAESSQEHVNENLINDEITKVFRNTDGRVIVACIGSNITRIQQLLVSAHKTGRTVFFTGDSLYEIVDAALRLDKIHIPSRSTIGKIEEIDQYDDERVVVIETGNIGEPIRGIQDMTNGRHKQVQIKEGDLVYVATTPSISIEVTMAETKDMVYKAGGRVKTLSDNFKVSGHATPNDLRLMLNFMKPNYLMPINGESRMIHAHKQIALELGYSPKQILTPNLGDVISFESGQAELISSVPAGDVLVDGIGVGDVGNVVLRDRRILSEDGIFIIAATISRRAKKILTGPQITSRGFVFMKTSGDLVAECSDLTLDILEKHLSSSKFDWNDLKNDIREKIGRHLYKETKRRPVILPIIMEASSYKSKK